MGKEALLGLYGLLVREITKWLRRRSQIVLAFTIPSIWLGLFGKSFDLSTFFKTPLDVPSEIREEVRKAMEGLLLSIFGSLDYFNFFTVGMLSAFALFTSIWSGMSLVWDRRLGYLERLLVAPIPRTNIYFSKVLASLFKGMIQFSAMLLIAFAIGFRPKPGLTALDIAALYSVMGALMLGLSAIFTAIAIKITSHDVVISVANLVSLPMLFTSNAIFPLRQMPYWLQPVAAVNPLTHSISIARSLLLGIGTPTQLFINVVYLIVFPTITLAVGSLLANRYL